MNYDVFISYSSKDNDVAVKVCHSLEKCGSRCWIAPRDIPGGSTYPKEIMSGIELSRIFLVIVSAHSCNSIYVPREVERAVAQGKPIIPVRIDTVPLTSEMEFFLSREQWLDAVSPRMQQQLDRLGQVVHERLKQLALVATPVPELAIKKDEPKPKTRKQVGWIIWTATLAVIAVAVYFGIRRDTETNGIRLEGAVNNLPQAPVVSKPDVAAVIPVPIVVNPPIDIAAHSAPATPIQPPIVPAPVVVAPDTDLPTNDLHRNARVRAISQTGASIENNHDNNVTIPRHCEGVVVETTNAQNLVLVQFDTIRRELYVDASLLEPAPTKP